MTEFKVFWTRVARQDLERIIDYIAVDSRHKARSVLAEIKEGASRLDHLANRGRIIPELKYQGIFLYREIVRRPWRIVYRVEDDKVWVLAVIDSRRNVEDLLLARLI